MPSWETIKRVGRYYWRVLNCPVGVPRALPGRRKPSRSWGLGDTFGLLVILVCFAILAEIGH